MTEFATDEVVTAAQAPVIAAALAARVRLDAAFAAQDVEAVATLFAKDLVVNTPANRVASRETVIGSAKV